MEKNRIKEILRESLNLQVRENEGEDGTNADNKKSGKKDYADIQNALNKDQNPTAPSQVGIMKTALGWDDDEGGTNRSYFGKLLSQEKNSDGSLYQFDDEQLARVRTALKIR